MTAVEAVAAIILTLGAYAGARWVHHRWRSTFTVPIFLATPVIMVVVGLSGLHLAGYNHGGNIIRWFLNPATVALAVPLYRHRRILVDHVLPVVVALVAGTLASMVVGVAVARLCGLAPMLQQIFVIKSATTPVALGLAPHLHLDDSVVAGFTVMTGLIGALVGPWLLDLVRVDDPVARGTALGGISSGIGTARAMGEDPLTGAAASVAMVLAALLIVALAPLAVSLAG